MEQAEISAAESQSSSPGRSAELIKSEILPGEYFTAVNQSCNVLAVFGAIRLNHIAFLTFSLPFMELPPCHFHTFPANVTHACIDTDVCFTNVCIQSKSILVLGENHSDTDISDTI